MASTRIDNSQIFSCKFSINTNNIVSCTATNSFELYGPGRLSIYKINNTHYLQQLQNLTWNSALLDHCWLANENKICCSSSDGQLLLWDLTDCNTQTPAASYPGHDGGIPSIFCKESSNEILSGSVDCTVKLWDLNNNGAVASYPLEDAVLEVTSTSVSLLMAAVLANRKVHLIDERSARNIRQLPVNQILSCAWSCADINVLYAAGWDGSISLIDLRRTGTIINNVKSHRGPIRQIKCIPASRNLSISAGFDGNTGMDERNAVNWTSADVTVWLQTFVSADDFRSSGLQTALADFDGTMLLLLRRDEIMQFLEKSEQFHYANTCKILYHIRRIQILNINSIIKLGYDPSYIISGLGVTPIKRPESGDSVCSNSSHHHQNSDRPEDGTATRLKPELGKTLISLGYLFLVTLITAFVMVIVHNRVPDMKKYPPLPDIFLDNVPHIPWAFAMCECTATLMCFIWVAVLVFHKHRFILLRRFFAISGTVFLLRCVTMLITSLSVPGTHLQCNPMAEEMQANDSIWSKMHHAYTIWSGAGMSIQGVRTCGDYMFSGHTSALTILNFFITEYTPRHLYFMHTFSWVLNMFGIFFILSAHEHYSIDVFIAFYITSRLFLYYHTLANNQALMQRDSTRTRIWFPLFSFFESEIDGIIPNEFETPSSLITNILIHVKSYWKYIYVISMRRQFVFESKKKM